MKIDIITNHKIYITNKLNKIENQITPIQPVQTDTVSFTAKIPSIVTPTMEDLIKRTKAIDVLRFNILRLAKFRIPCPVCGDLMLDVEKFNEFENKVMSTTKPKDLLKYVEELKEYLHPVEFKMYKMMKEMHLEHPEMKIHEMLKRKLSTSERKIIQEQSKILANLANIISKSLNIRTRLKVQELINETYARILDPRETSRFSRKIFLDKLKEALGIKPITIETNDGKLYEIRERYTPLQQRIMEEATKLPTAYNNEDAFIVKYAKRDYKSANPDQKIIIRILSNSLATIEHIKAQKLRGETSPPNLALECAACNNKKNHDSLLEQVIENPRMIFYYPKYIRRLCEIHLMGKVEKSYITQQNKTFMNDSYGLLEGDLSLIRYNPKRNKNPYVGTLKETTSKKSNKHKTKKNK